MLCCSHCYVQQGAFRIVTLLLIPGKFLLLKYMQSLFMSFFRLNNKNEKDNNALFHGLISPASTTQEQDV